MVSISDRIKSMRETMGVEYTRPDPARLDAMILALQNSSEAKTYLRDKRGMTEDTMVHFKLGFDADKNAIAIPLFKNGELINIKYRFLEPGDGPRYIGEPGAETWVFNEDGLNYAHTKGTVLIVEGEFDAMAVWQSGSKNVISPSSGKDSFGVWLELLEKVPRVYIAYDNDEGGKTAADKLASRLGTEKCTKVVYEDAKDANEYLMKHTPDEFRQLVKSSKPMMQQQFKTVGDVIGMLQKGLGHFIDTRLIPGVKFQRGWMAILSGRSNVGKTSYVMNIANDIASKGTGVLILPFERGIESVGQRLVQVVFDAKQDDFSMWTEADWTAAKTKCSDIPIYFAMPSKEDTIDFIIKAKRYLNAEVVIVDHLDYMIRQVNSSRGDVIMDTLQQLKRVAEENGIVLLIVTHIRKIEKAGEFIARNKRPNIEDLKGSSSLYQDPEVVVMLSETNKDSEILVDVLKNKGEMMNKIFVFDRATGVYHDSFGTSTIATNESVQSAVAESEDLWDSIQ